MNTEEMIALMQAHLRGEVIEYRSRDIYSDDWSVNKNPAWEFSRFEYRIKPREPREWNISVQNGRMAASWRGKFSTMDMGENEVIRVREVID